MSPGARGRVFVVAAAAAVLLWGCQGKSGDSKPAQPVPTCTVTGVFPGSGDVSGGNLVTITGVDFVRWPTAVTFGTVVAPPATYLDPFTIRVVVPPSAGGAAGAVDVMVEFSNGASCSLSSAYVYTVPTCVISAISPDFGFLPGGEPVTINGAGFEQTATITFGGVPAANVTAISYSRITCSTPAGVQPGAVDVTIDQGTSSCTAQAGFTYLGAGECAIFGMSPAASGLAGSGTVTITGLGFEEPPNPAPEVLFGSIPGTNVVVQPGGQAITVDVPAAASPRVVSVTVTNQTSGFSHTLQDGFRYLAPGECFLVSVVPNVGPVSGGNLVTITGVDLDPNPLAILMGVETVDLGTLTEIIPNEVYQVIVPGSFAAWIVDVTYVNPGPTVCTLINGYEYQ